MARGIGAAVLIAVIAVFSLFGGYRTLNGMRKTAESVYSQGAEGDGMGIAHDLEQRAGTALKLAVVAQEYIDSTDPLMTDFLSAMNALTQAGSPSEQYEANAALTGAAARLNAALEQMNLSEADESFRRGYFSDLLSRNEIIGHNPYNAEAEEFNFKLSAFPAGLIAKFTGIRPLELFR